jgi:hypothetical protein
LITHLILLKLIDHVEYRLVTGASSFDERSGICLTAKKPAEDRDLLREKFDWISSIFSRCRSTLDGSSEFRVQV